MTRTLCVVVVCALVVWGFAGEAMAYDGNSLLRVCKKYIDDPPISANALDIGMCMGYVTGVMETGSHMQSAGAKATYCMPDEVEIQQLARIVVKYLEEHPADLHYKAAAAVLFSFIDAFPCTGE